MSKKIGLLALLICYSINAMQQQLDAKQLLDLQKRFNTAVTAEKLDEAQTLLNQIRAGGRGALAVALQGQIEAKKLHIKQRADSVAANQRLKEEAERKKQAAAQEARQREEQARQDKARRDQEEARLKADSANASANAETNKKLLAEIHTKNTQIDTLNNQINELKQQQLNAQLNVLEIQGKCENQLAQAHKQAEEAAAAVRNNYEQLLADAQKAGQSSTALESQLQQMRSQVSQLETQLAQANKDKEALKAGTVTQKANEELRTRLADTEKALQAQTKKALDCEKQTTELTRQIQTSGSNKARIDELSKKREELESRLKNLIESTNKEKQAAQKTEEALRKQIDEMKKNQGTPAEQAQKSQIIQKKQDELYAANQQLEKQVRQLTTQLEVSQKEAKDLASALKTNKDLMGEKELELLDCEALKSEAAKAQKELAEAQKEIRAIAKDLKEQKESYAALSFDRSKKDYEKEKKELQAKYAADLEAIRKENKEETLKVFKDAQEKVAKFKENQNASIQSAISFANNLMRQKEIKPIDLRDLIDILKQR